MIDPLGILVVVHPDDLLPSPLVFVLVWLPLRLFFFFLSRGSLPSLVSTTSSHTRQFLAGENREADYQPLRADPDAGYDVSDTIDLGTLEPLIAKPSSPGNVVRSVRRPGQDARRSNCDGPDCSALRVARACPPNSCWMWFR